MVLKLAVQKVFSLRYYPTTNCHIW